MLNIEINLNDRYKPADMVYFSILITVLSIFRINRYFFGHISLMKKRPKMSRDITLNNYVVNPVEVWKKQLI